MEKKRDLLNQVAQNILISAETLKRQTQETRKASIEAEGPMVTRYDTMKSEMDWLSHGLALATQEAREQLEELERLDLSPCILVKLGAIVKVDFSDTEDQTKMYFVLSGGAGISVLLGEDELQVITPSSPLGQALMGKHSGDSFTVRTPRAQRDGVVRSVE